MTDDEIEINWNEVKIVWHNNKGEIEDIDRLVLEDCAESLNGLEKVSELIFHHVFLGKDMNTDAVFCWGNGEDEDLHCEFLPEVDWSSVDDEE